MVRHVCDRIAVMSQGQIVEMAETEEIYTAPKHPYTRTLLAASHLAPSISPVYGRTLVSSTEAAA